MSNVEWGMQNSKSEARNPKPIQNLIKHKFHLRDPRSKTLPLKSSRKNKISHFNGTEYTEFSSRCSHPGATSRPLRPLEVTPFPNRHLKFEIPFPTFAVFAIFV